MLSKSKIIVFAVFINSFAFAQNEMSLKQCVEFGIQNNLSLQKSSLEVDKNKQKEREVLSSALPQINGSAVLNDNLNLATQLIPGEIVGKPGTMIPVRFGTQYNLTVGVSASQMIYLHSCYTCLESRRRFGCFRCRESQRAIGV
jgi:outer membrane protein